ncbi:phosphoglycerate mutase [Gordonia spumicola]|uniref:Phosphoglycerate mutase n=1 Tax=Gordonia spumicola TaxID=589161 RepID=A0A7I9VBX6_9ACTN|nr:histidine phosphatase family protein [Gordonia spumicola]GEE02774.1 phosphoglycerate mutase [Gordonia spumicola]
MHHVHTLRTRLAAAVLVAAASFGFAAPVHAEPAAPAEITLTLVRHAESAGNASGLVDTKTPGPDLTELGRTQARQVAALLADRGFDGVYASRMVRTQQTATPLARTLHKRIVVLPGVHEILAGDYEGSKEADAQTGYMVAPMKWLRGDLTARIPGAESGTEFKQRVDSSIDTVVKQGKKNPVIFSHGGTIMIWAMLTATNGRDYAAKIQTDYLRNVGRVVLKGNPTTGWKIVEWDGKPTLPTVPDCVSTGSGTFDPTTFAPC